MRPRTRFALLAALVLVAVTFVGTLPSSELAGSASAALPAAGGDGPVTVSSQDNGTESLVEDCAARPPANGSDPERDVVGWENGTWYNESIGVDPADGLSASEFDALAERTAARVEALRCLEMEEMPEIEVMTRSEFDQWWRVNRNDYTFQYRQWLNGYYATMLAAGQDETVLGPRAVPTSRGRYTSGENTVRIVTNATDPLRVSEPLLAHELAHALQHQQVSVFTGSSTIDERRAGDAVVEGDAEYVEHRYADRCADGRWGDPCARGSRGNESFGLNWIRVLAGRFPYSEGAAYVHRVRQSGGWGAVNIRLQNPPKTTAEVINESDGPEVRRSVDLPDASSGEWEPVQFTLPLSTSEMGRATLSTMLMAPTLEANETVVVPESTVRADDDPYRTYNYDLPQTDGWQGDRLRVYQRSVEELGSVWRIAWQSATDAREFADAYRTLVDYRGGEPVPGTDDVYRLPEESAFEMAVAVRQDEDVLTIVTAPSPGDLTEVHGRIDVNASAVGETDGSSSEDTATTEQSATDTTATATASSSGDPPDTSTAGTETDATQSTTASASGPGFAVSTALAALAALLVASVVGTLFRRA